MGFWKVLPVVAAALAAGCASDGAGEGGGEPAHDHASMSAPASGAWAGVTEAMAQVRGLGKNKVHGLVVFTETAEGVRVVADVDGLKPNSKHAFHIHEFGDLTNAEGKSAGPHYNPEGHKHGGPDGASHHAGDLGNLESNAKGRAHYDRVIPGISVAGDRNPVVGRSVIVHEKTDDLVTDPSGAAGDRIAGGVIGVAKPGEPHVLAEPTKKSK